MYLVNLPALEVLRAMPGVLCKRQNWTPGWPGKPKLGKVSQPSWAQRLSTTLTMPSNLCCPQNIPPPEPGILQVACFGHPGCIQCLWRTSTIPFSMCSLQYRPRVSPVLKIPYILLMDPLSPDCLSSGEQLALEYKTHQVSRRGAALTQAFIMNFQQQESGRLTWMIKIRLFGAILICAALATHNIYHPLCTVRSTIKRPLQAR